MTDRAAFARLVEALSPWSQQVVFVGGWAHRLYRLHDLAETPAYQPLATLDADVAFAERERLEGSIKQRLLAAGFQEQLTGITGLLSRNTHWAKTSPAASTPSS